MSRHNQREEKLVLRDDVHPEKYSPFYNLTPEDYLKVWDKVKNTGDRYAIDAAVDEDWNDVIDVPENADHERLGLGLSIVNMNIPWANPQNRYRNNEWNRYMNLTVNTLVMQLRQYASTTRKGTLSKLLEVPNAEMMHTVIKRTLDQLFDTQEYDTNTFEGIDNSLS